MPVVPRRRTFYEIFDEVDKTLMRSNRVKKLRDEGTYEIKFLLNLVHHPKIKFLLPEGVPNFKKPEEEDGVLVLRLHQEIKKLQYYLNVGPYPNLKPIKRETMFTDLLSTLHPDDAKLLCAIKDKKLPFKNIPKDVVEEAFPDLKDKWIKEDPNKVQAKPQPAPPAIQRPISTVQPKQPEIIEEMVGKNFSAQPPVKRPRGRPRKETL